MLSPIWCLDGPTGVLRVCVCVYSMFANKKRVFKKKTSFRAYFDDYRIPPNRKTRDFKQDVIFVVLP